MMPYIKSLAGIRFIAVSFIVLHHMVGLLWIPKGFGLSFYPNLGNAVTFFFCLSGFVLHYNYHSKIKTISYWKFVLLRYLRVWPLHAVIFVISIFLFYPQGTKWIFNNLSWLELAQIFTLTQSITPIGKVYYGVNGVSWFISTLVFFYVFFPFISVGISRKLWVTIFIILSVISVYLMVASTIVYDPEITGNAHGLGAINPIPRLFDFTLGIATCECLLRLGLVNYKKKQTIDEHHNFWTIIEFSVFAIVLIAAYFSTHFIYHFRSYLNPVTHHWLLGSLPSLFYCAFIALITYEKGGVSRLFSTKVFIWFGSISFAIFLVHQRLIVFWQRNIVPSLMPLPLQVLSFMVTLVAISACGYYFIELPVTNKMRKFINKYSNP